jgi:hypothetical protein
MQQAIAPTRKSNAASSRSEGTCQATSAPGARFVAMSVWRIRRTTPASSIARRRSNTVSSGSPLRRAISANGSSWNPTIRSSLTARMRALIGSLISVARSEDGMIER